MSQSQIKHLTSSTLTLTQFVIMGYFYVHGVKIMYWKGVSLFGDKREMTVVYRSVEGGALHLLDATTTLQK